jgi:predicted lipid-binding transport protein (Tim44 family)
MSSAQRTVLGALLCALVTLLPAGDVLAAAGGGSSGFGGGGGGGGASGGGGGGFGGGGSGGAGGGGGGLIGLLIIGVLVLLFVASAIVTTIKVRRKRRAREARVSLAAAEAAEDDAAFAAPAMVSGAQQLFDEVQKAWTARDREHLATLVGDDLFEEWRLRLDDFDRRGWHNRVRPLQPPKVRYMGLRNREADADDRAIVFIEAYLEDFVVDRDGQTVTRGDSSDNTTMLKEYWTLGKRDGRWIVISIEQDAEGEHNLDDEIVASPWADSRVRDDAVIETAVADGLPEGFTPADVADLDFDGDARAAALDLSLADPRFAPDVLEAAARRAVEAWAEAVDGDDGALHALAGDDAVSALLYPGGAGGRTRLVVRGPRVRRISIEILDAGSDPALMTIAVELGGCRYMENRDTAAVVSGSRDVATTFVERWTLALEGPEDRPWRLSAAGGSPQPA